MYQMICGCIPFFGSFLSDDITKIITHGESAKEAFKSMRSSLRYEFNCRLYEKHRVGFGKIYFTVYKGYQYEVCFRYRKAERDKKLWKCELKYTGHYN